MGKQDIDIARAVKLQPIQAIGEKELGQLKSNFVSMVSHASAADRTARSCS